jgi:hypothetical protein
MRKMLRSLASAWLVCQLAGFAAAPIAASCGLMQMAADGEEQCCPGLAPGQACPMHHNRTTAKTCVVRNACAPSPAALLTLMGGLGLLPPSLPATTAIVRGEIVTVSSATAIARAGLPDSPPPRV